MGLNGNFEISLERIKLLTYGNKKKVLTSGTQMMSRKPVTSMGEFRIK